MDDPVFQPPAHCEIGGFITIQTGDTLYSIAQRYGVTVQAIISANPELILITFRSVNGSAFPILHRDSLFQKLAPMEPFIPSDPAIIRRQ